MDCHNGGGDDPLAGIWSALGNGGRFVSVSPSTPVQTRDCFSILLSLFQLEGLNDPHVFSEFAHLVSE